jgi:hypothetical protein
MLFAYQNPSKPPRTGNEVSFRKNSLTLFVASPQTLWHVPAGS